MIKIKKNKNKPSFFSLAKLKKILNTNPGSSSTRQKIIICGLFIFFTLIIIKLINLQVFQHSDQDQFVNSMAYKESEELQLERNRRAILENNYCQNMILI